MKYLINTFALLCILIAVGCSRDKKPANVQKVETSNGSTDNQIATTQHVHIYGINKLKYVVKEKSDALKISGTVTINGTKYYLLQGIKTKSGQQMTVKLTTLSDMPASSMSHNWLLLKQKADASAFARVSLQDKENDYVAPEKMDFVIIETGLVAPGKTVTITFTVPNKIGEYKYICTFPGHYTAGMKGTLYVK